MAMSVSAASNVDASGLLLLTVREAAERLDEPVRLHEVGWREEWKKVAPEGRWCYSYTN